jgi:hypothetical protein
MDGPTFPSPAYTLSSVTATNVNPPASQGDATGAQTHESNTNAPTSSTSSPARPTSSGPLGDGAPGFAIAFPAGMAGQYVLDCRDPKTNAVLVQVPLYSALTQIEGAATPEHCGKHVDTVA